MYGSGCSGIGLGVVGALALLLKAAMVSATEDVNVRSPASLASLSEDRETDQRDNVDSI